MSTSNNTHANSVASSATSGSSHHHHPSNSTRRSPASGAGPGGGGGGGGGGGKNRSGGGGASSGTSTATTTTTTTTTPTPACAACKYQRRKCNPDCTLAPYFPADHQRQFLNAHRLFGVSNIIKTLRGLDPSQRAAAMGSIIFQSDARARDPVGGCYRIILELQRQVDRSSAELDLVLRHLAICRAQAQPPPPPVPAPSLSGVASSTINLIDQADDPSCADDGGVVGMSTFPQEQQEQEQQQQEQQYLYYYFGGGDDGNANDIAMKDVHGADVEQAPASPLLVQQYHRDQQCVDDGGDGVVKPAPVEEALFDVVRQHQAFLVAGDEDDGSKDGSPDLDYRRSNNSVRLLEMKEDPNSMEEEQENDLKSAASLFKLTNCELSGGV